MGGMINSSTQDYYHWVRRIIRWKLLGERNGYRVGEIRISMEERGGKVVWGMFSRNHLFLIAPVFLISDHGLSLARSSKAGASTPVAEDLPPPPQYVGMM